MKRMGKAGFIGLMAIFLSVLAIGGLAGNAAAVTFTLGTMTGNGTASFGPGGSLDWSFSGQFTFDPTLTAIFGDQGQFVFMANSSGTVPAYDYSAPYPTSLPNWPPPPAPAAYVEGLVSKGGFGFDLNNTGHGGPHSSTFYGSVLNFVFSGDYPSGTVTGAFRSEGNIHWYYGLDDFNVTGYPRGMTPLAAWGINDTFNINGNYTVTKDLDTSFEFSLTNGTVTGSAVPLPPAVLLMGSGLLGLVGLGWRRARKES